MKPRNTLILVVVAVILVAYVVLVESPLTQEQVNMRLGTPTLTPAPYMFQLDANSVKSFIITDLRFPRAVTVVRTDTGWQVTQPIEREADKDKSNSVAAALANVKVARVLSNVSSLAPFGLAPGTLEARFIMNDGTTYAFVVGNKTPDGLNYYVAYTGDQTRVFLIDTPLVESLKVILDVPPFQPTATPTPTAAPPATETPTVEATPGLPGFVPTLLPMPTATPKP